MARKRNTDRFYALLVNLLYTIAALLLIISLLVFSTYIIDENPTALGSVGDAIGGITAPFIGLASIIATFLAFFVQFLANKYQRDDIKVERFENKFYEMLRLHRTNVSEMKYRLNDISEENRRVFKVMFDEFEEVYKDVLRFYKGIEFEDYMNESYRIKLRKIINNNNLKVRLTDLAKIDLAYSIFFYGVSSEGVRILKHKYRNKFLLNLHLKLFFYLMLKPRKSNKKGYAEWKKLRSKPPKYIRETIDRLYNKRNDKKLVDVEFSKLTLKPIKYYGGHQLRLGHYFRHLFQSFEYINESTLGKEERYNYGKILRGQLSNYEQAILFVNSLTSLGMKWEYTHPEGAKLITTYQLIKNLPGIEIVNLKFKRFYSNIRFEWSEK
jgi:hypothetical protein